MSYRGVSIIKDVNDKPIPQYWNPEIGNYEVVIGSNGAYRTIVVDSNGNEIYSQELVNSINNEIQELVRVVENIGV